MTDDKNKGDQAKGAADRATDPGKPNQTPSSGAEGKSASGAPGSSPSPTSSVPSGGRPTTAQPGDSKPADTKPSDAKAVADKPGERKPASGGPATTAPGGPPKTPATKPPQASGRKRSGCLSGVFWFVVVVAVVGVGGYFTWPYWSSYAEPYLSKLLPPGGDTAAERAALEQRVVELEKTVEGRQAEIEAIRSLQGQRAELRQQLDEALNRVGAMEQAITSLSQLAEALTSGDNAKTGDALNGYSERLGEIETKLAVLNRLESQVSGLEGQVTQLEQEGSSRGSDVPEAAALVLAVGQLSGALNQSGGFESEIMAVETAGGSDSAVAAAINTLKPMAATGVPTFANLRSRFPAIAAEVARTRGSMEGDGWIENAVNRVTSLVSVRRTGSAAVEAGGIDSALARAEETLSAGDLSATVAALEGLDGNAAAAAAPWIADARARLAADRALSTLQSRSIELLAAGRG